MTIAESTKKKPTTLEVFATPDEREAAVKAIDALRENMIFDINADQKMFGGSANKKAIPGAIDESGASNPILYYKLDNFFKELRNALATQAVTAELTFKPNEISKSSGDVVNNRTYTKSMNKLREALDSLIIKRKDKTLSNLFGQSDFQIISTMNLSGIEGLTAGKRLQDLVLKGKTVPEYGATKIPTSTSRRFFQAGSHGEFINTALIVVVEDESEQGLVQNLQMPITIDGKAWKILMDEKKRAIADLGATALSGYKHIKSLKPNTKLDILQMAVALSVAQNEGIMGVRPILAPQVNEWLDPDNNQVRKFYTFTIGGYKGTRTGGGSVEVAEDIQSIPTF